MTESAAALGNRDNSCYVSWDQLDDASKSWLVADGAPGSPFDSYHGKFLPLPDWFDRTLPPLSAEYFAQQERLWKLMSGSSEDYVASRDEQVGVDESDVLVHPGFYASSVYGAGHHLIAMGHILVQSGLRPGDRVLEYGAGFGQIALTLARLGVIVDTVDIDPGFCSAVNKQAKWFGVDLTAYEGQFGDNPTGHKYAAILFYECFHHARDFPRVIERARDILQPGGQIIMAGESIEPASDPNFAKVCPYPWGMRLDIGNASIVRFRKWFELGFQEEFIYELFDSYGFTPNKYLGSISHCATVYTFTMRSRTTYLSQWANIPAIAATWWDAEQEGRWTRGKTIFPLETKLAWSQIEIDCVNYLPVEQRIKFVMGEVEYSITLSSGEEAKIHMSRVFEPASLLIFTVPVVPKLLGFADERALGVYVRSISYLD